MRKQGVLLVVAGPSGVGKGTIINRIIERNPEVRCSVSCTTRAPRPGEVDGQDYYFVTVDEFHRMREQGELLEWALVHQDLLYGTPRKPVEEALERAEDLILEIDYQGARSLRQALGDRATLVFVAPPRWQDLVDRLHGRSTEDDEATKKRLGSAIHEFAHVELFEYLIINEDLEQAVSQLEAILKSERQRLKRLNWEPFIEGLLRDAGH
ncbi:MAG: guanylate kinase [Armatimonadia bacterium]